MPIADMRLKQIKKNQVCIIQICSLFGMKLSFQCSLDASTVWENTKKTPEMHLIVDTDRRNN